MILKIKSFINYCLGFSGYQLIKSDTLNHLERIQYKAKKMDFFKKYYPQNTVKYFENIGNSKSQIQQDLFVLAELNFKEQGYFVEFGATNGKTLSNTYLMEKYFNWKGILAEPAICWHSSLESNRSAIIEKECLWSTSGEEVNFLETEDSNLSTIQGFGKTDEHKNLRKQTKSYKVKTISLTDLLNKHKAPLIIDYLSIDTEGTEYRILKAFEFRKYKFRVITVEHNYTSDREKIHSLLSQNGYTRKHENFSLFDDWYVHKDEL